MRLLVVRYLALAVAQTLMRARGSSGALCVRWRLRRSLLLEFVRSFVRSGGQSVSRAVLNDDARAGRL